jgi:multidrug transporter EmrE-like cation transporter
MKAADLGWLLAGVMLNALAQLGLKTATASTGVISGSWRAVRIAGQQLAANGAFWLALAAYGVSVAVWTIGLSRLPVSQAYPVLSVGYIVTALLAWAFLGETISLARWSGIGLIVAGVLLVSRSHG